MPTEKPDRSDVSTFASRRAEREAREAAGGHPAYVDALPCAPAMTSPSRAW